MIMVSSHKKALTSVSTSVCLATSYSRRGKPPTTIGAKELNFCVRHGNRCDLFAIITRLLVTASSLLRLTLSATSFTSSHTLVCSGAHSLLPRLTRIVEPFVQKMYVKDCSFKTG